MDRFELQKRYLAMGIGDLPVSAIRTAMQPSTRTTERGARTTPENAIKYLYRQMWTDPDLRASILDIRYMDRVDPRVKKIHTRTARAATKGGLILKTSNKRAHRLWGEYVRRLHLNKQEKLESDMRGLMMEGNLYLQWVIGEDRLIHSSPRFAAETMIPRVTSSGVFEDLQAAYEQYDLMSGQVLAKFPYWMIGRARLTPDSYDDMGSLGRPYLDATRGIWKKLTMTEEDMVIRRKTRAPMRKVHQLKNVDQEFFEKYKAKVEEDIYDQTTDHVIKGEGDVKALQGDASLDQIADVEYLLDTFFSGSPAPKGLFGYVGDLNRDILEDLKNDFFDELDALQDTLSDVYEQGFRLELLLRGINPDNIGMEVQFAERRTETPNQAADRALKLKALGSSIETAHQTAGLDPHLERQRKEQEEKENYDPYPEEGANGPKVSITPNNAPKGESATSISNK